MGEVPNSFVTTIRALVADEAKTPGQYGPASTFSASRLLKSPALSIPIGYASALFHPTRQPQNDRYTELYAPLDLAALLATLYTYRKARKRAAEELWKPFAPHVCNAIDIGGLVGLAIPQIGFAYGMLAGAFSFLSIAPFMIQDPRVYKAFKRKVLGKKRYDMAVELKELGCTHAHVCSFLIPALGLGVDLAKTIMEGLLAEVGTAPAPNEERYRVYIARIWIESLMNTGNIPDITHKGGFYPLKADLTRLLERVEARASLTPWLERGKDDGPAGSRAAGEEAADEVAKELESS